MAKLPPTCSARIKLLRLEPFWKPEYPLRPITNLVIQQEASTAGHAFRLNKSTDGNEKVLVCVPHRHPQSIRKARLQRMDL